MRVRKLASFAGKKGVYELLEILRYANSCSNCERTEYNLNPFLSSPFIIVNENERVKTGEAWEQS